VLNNIPQCSIRIPCVKLIYFIISAVSNQAMHKMWCKWMILDSLRFLNTINYKIRLLVILLYVPEWDMAIQIYCNVVENAEGNNKWSGKRRILPLLIILVTNIIDCAWSIRDKRINQSLSTKLITACCDQLHSVNQCHTEIWRWYVSCPWRQQRWSGLLKCVLHCSKLLGNKNYFFSISYSF
jgi:hypothetical protein